MLKPNHEYFTLSSAIRLRQPFKTAASLASTEERMKLPDSLIQESLMQIVDSSKILDSFWQDQTDYNSSIVSLYHIYHLYPIKGIKEAINRLNQRFGKKILLQSSIYQCVEELIAMYERQNTNKSAKTIKWSFTDWWGQTNLEHSIITFTLKNTEEVNYEFTMPCEADLIIYNVYTYYHKFYGNTVKRVFWTNEHDFVDINYAAFSMAPSNVFDLEPHIRYPGWYSCIPISEDSFYGDRFGKIYCDYANDQSNMGENMGKEFDISIIISNPVCNRMQFVELLEKEGLKVNKAGRAYGRPIKSKAKILHSSKMNICFENTIIPGYVTEKLPDAKLNGCIPIYWGPYEASKDFNERCFLNLAQVKDIKRFIIEIKEILNDPISIANIHAEPLFAQKPEIEAYIKRVRSLFLNNTK